MNIGLYNIDSKIPNIALMKISAYHKAKGNAVAWFSPIEAPSFDLVYASSVFTWSDKSYAMPYMICGGTGFDIKSVLNASIEECDPDYSLYPDFKQALGFLTRGCIRKCSFCFVPEKEGAIRPYRDIEEIAGERKEVILMDNNFLAAGDYAREQAEKIIKGRYKIDFNQGLDARLIDDSWARTLAKFRWLAQLRMACDSDAMIDVVIEATERLRKHHCTPSRYFVYTLVTDIESAYKRVMALHKHNLTPFAQPFRDANGTPPTDEQRNFARWVNHIAIFNSVPWEEYRKKEASCSKRA